jgi:hypothetical protein
MSTLSMTPTCPPMRGSILWKIEINSSQNSGYEV